jgi:chitinase
VKTVITYTITSCQSTVTDCPAKLGQVTTETVDLYTTVCPVTTSALPTTTTSLSVATSAPLYTTSTIYTTKVYTITSCAPSVSKCPGLGSVTTEVIPVTTTVCPVTSQPAGSGFHPTSKSCPPGSQCYAAQTTRSVSSFVYSTVTKPGVAHAALEVNGTAAATGYAKPSGQTTVVGSQSTASSKPVTAGASKNTGLGARIALAVIALVAFAM